MTNDKWVWYSGIGLTTLALLVGLALIVALALGWNSPRPTDPPDWAAAAPVILTASGETAVRLLGHSVDDFSLEAEAVPLSGPDFNGYGLVYRAQGPARYYVFAVGSDGYYGVLRVEEEEETVLVEWQPFPHLRRGRQANRLRVACVGPTCRLYVNDEYATTVEDNAWLAGEVGLWARSFGGENVAVRFLSARVWENGG